MRALWIVVFGIAAAMAAGCSRQESSWEIAAERDSVAAYEEYLRRYPAGAHSDEAQTRIKALREAEAWASASRLRMPEAWQRYLADWPEGRACRRGEARARGLRTGRAAARPAGSCAQLGAFSSEAAARAELARLMREQAALLVGSNWQVIAPAAGEPALWRLRIGPLPEEEARGLCASLKDRGVDCMPVAG